MFPGLAVIIETQRVNPGLRFSNIIRVVAVMCTERERERERERESLLRSLVVSPQVSPT